jgi:hypothetical protein
MVACSLRGLKTMTESKSLHDVVDHYRQLADEAENMAVGCVVPPKYRDAYRKMARHWTALAEELEECLEEEITLH